MFYENQTEEQQNNYKNMLSLIGSLSRIFSESDSPFLQYRAHENIFCKYLEAENLARLDCSADAKKYNIGVGLKTWTGRNDQKVAEFGKLRNNFKNLCGLELIKKISAYRNDRIRVTKNLYGIETMIYHIIKRIPNKMQIIECSFDYIDIDNIIIDEKRGNDNNTYFNDGNHTYHFSLSKNTLYMIFENYNLIEEFEVNIFNDPYTYLLDLQKNNEIDLFSSQNMLKVSDNLSNYHVDSYPKLCLKLYSENSKKGKFVPEKSGLNHWNAKGRKRSPNEIYIPYPAYDRKKSQGFFPPNDQTFSLLLPDGTNITAKVCQSDDKAIMSNPNKALGEWLLRDVFELKEGTLVTYEHLESFNVDSVIFIKLSDHHFKIHFTEIGTYEKFDDKNI